MRNWAIALAVAVLVFTPSRAGSTIFVSPANPTEADTLRITVSQGFSGSCWRNVDHACLAVRADTLEIVASIQYCEGQPSCLCADVPSSYAFTCVVGRLPHAAYRVFFHEVRLNWADPRPVRVEGLRFTVGASTPATRTTWGRLKIHCP